MTEDDHKYFSKLKLLNGKIDKETEILLKIWTNTDLLEFLINSSDSQFYSVIKKLFEKPIKLIPEFLLLKLVQTNPSAGSFLLDELYTQLLPPFLVGNNNSQIVLNALWVLNKDILIKSMGQLYRYCNAMNLSRVLDIVNQIKDSFMTIVCYPDFEFTVQLGILAAKREFLHLDKWVKKQIENEGTPFVAHILQYLERNIIDRLKDRSNTLNTDEILDKSQLNIEKLTILFENIQDPSRSQFISKPTLDRAIQIYEEMTKTFPTLISQASDNIKVEKEANDCFNQLYQGLISVEELIQKIQRYKRSTDKKENEVYACMIQNLFDEFKFFHKYPDKELKLTGLLFGSIIKHDIIEGVVMKIGFKCVFEALKKKGKMFQFGINALEKCKDQIAMEESLLDQFLGCDELQSQRNDLWIYLHDRLDRMK